VGVGNSAISDADVPIRTTPRTYPLRQATLEHPNPKITPMTSHCQLLLRVRCRNDWLLTLPFPLPNTR